MPVTYEKEPHIGLDPVTVDWSKFDRNPKFNPKEIPVGSVAYYVRRRHNRYSVDYGIVYDHYKDYVALQKVCPRDRRTVISEFFKKPVPFKEFPYQTEWRKLPKGWSWDTRLYEILNEPMTDEEACYALSADDPASIIGAYNRGYLVNVRDVPYEKISVVIEKSTGYKLVRESRESERVIDPLRPVDSVGVDPFQCFSTFAEAKAACDKAEAELFEQSNMTDLEWSLRLIDGDIDRWARNKGVSEENKARVRGFLMQLKDLENLETRVVGEGLQYKYWKNARWVNVPVE